MKTENYSKWQQHQQKNNIHAIQLAVNGHEYNLRINIDISRLMNGADIHDFINLQQSQELLEFLFEVAVQIQNDARESLKQKDVE